MVRHPWNVSVLGIPEFSVKLRVPGEVLQVVVDETPSEGVEDVEGPEGELGLLLQEMTASMTLKARLRFGSWEAWSRR